MFKRLVLKQLGLKNLFVHITICENILKKAAVLCIVCALSKLWAVDLRCKLPTSLSQTSSPPRYDFDTWSCSQETQVRLFIGLYEDLFPGVTDRDLLIRFTLTVK